MRDYDQLMYEALDTRNKVYYNLLELEKLTGMSIRALKYRMLQVKEKYSNEPFLLAKKNREWRIHYTIIQEFEPKYNTKNRTLHTYRWASMATWNPKFNYDVNYHVTLVEAIKKQLPDNLISYVVELDGREFNHTHVISDVEPHVLNKAVNTTLDMYIGNSKELKVEVEPINNQYATVEYLKKAPLAKGVLYPSKEL